MQNRGLPTELDGTKHTAAGWRTGRTTMLRRRGIDPIETAMMIFGVLVVTSLALMF
jgi:hypothetical protein